MPRDSEPSEINSSQDSFDRHTPIPVADPIPAHETIRDLVTSLPENERFLIERIFWHGDTETELARESCISQCALNKRKKKILLTLRSSL
jgi:DNA-directed RNA polymerase specialized sigma subunit